MIVWLTLTVGLVLWVVGYAFGLKSFDVFILSTTLVMGAAGLWHMRPFLNRRLRRERRQPRDRLGPPTAPGSSPG